MYSSASGTRLRPELESERRQDACKRVDELLPFGKPGAWSRFAAFRVGGVSAGVSVLVPQIIV